MNDNYSTKEVYFDEYCCKCVHKDDPERMSDMHEEDVCHWCLGVPYNINSHKPVRFEEAEVKSNEN
jgi:hypothetical protein